jgi:hypothetical protein
MKAWIALVLMAATGLGAMSAQALDAATERYTKMLASGGPGTIGSAAESIASTGITDPEVLDLVAQVLSDIHLKNTDDHDYAETTSWLCKALGGSGNGRYKPLLDEVSASPMSRKARGYCEKAAKQLPAASADPFKVGSVVVDNYKDGGPAYAAGGKKPTGAATKAAAAAPAAPAGPKAVDFSIIREGMSSQEVSDLIGQPSAQTNHMTGKQFIPFNFGARDLQRMNYLYKGVGHIEFSLKSAYNGVFRVIKIVPDPNETGYP